MKANLALETNVQSFFPLLDDTQTVGSLVEDKTCLCISADTPIETVLAMRPIWRPVSPP